MSNTNNAITPANASAAPIVQGDFGFNMVDFDVMALNRVDTEYLKVFAPGFEMDDVDAFNALQSPAKTVNDSIGDVFNLTGLIVHPVQVVNDSTGEVVPAPRIILIGSNGESYVSVSKTLFSSLKNLFAMYRRPESWPTGGIPIKLKQYSKGSKRYFSIELVKSGKK